MPLYQEWSPDDHSLAAIWHIDEPEDYFLDRTGISSAIAHPRKRIEHLCGRHLLQHIKSDFPLLHIAPDQHDKPRLPQNRYFFSISHSYPYVAAVISDREECGIDIQIWKARIAQIAYMYLSQAEQVLCAPPDAEPYPELLTLAWSVKEAVYKWWGRRGVEFIDDLPIRNMLLPGDIYPPAFSTEIGIDMTCFGVSVQPKAFIYRDFSLSLIVKERL